MSSRDATGTPESSAASGRFGVTRVASGRMRSRSDATASAASRRWPCFETNTGSTTSFGIPTAATVSATAFTIGAEASIPVFAASTPMSCATARICAATVSGAISWNPETPVVFCTVTAVIAVVAKTPKAPNVLRSAWMPAPPPESDPAIDSARGREGSATREVVPSLRLERPLLAVVADDRDALLRSGLSDLRERDAEAVAESLRGAVEHAGGKHCEELVVLSAGERDVERIDAEPLRVRGDRRRDGNPGRADQGSDPARPAQPGQVARQPVGEIHHRRRTRLRERLPLSDPRRRTFVRAEELPSPSGSERLTQHVLRRA